MKKEQRVSAIERGTAIDHIPVDAVFQVVDVLKLEKHPNMVSIATNLASKKMGTKAIIKVEDRYLSDEEISKVSVLAPDATVSSIKDFKVTKKLTVTLPEKVAGVIRCSNPQCITNHENVTSSFTITRKDPLKVRCHYCERSMSKQDIKVV